MASSAGDQLTRHVRLIARIIGSVATAGLVAGMVLLAALAPWLLRLDGAVGVVLLVVLAGALLLPPLLVSRHRRSLLDVYGDRDRLTATMRTLGDAAEQVPDRVRSIESPVPTGRLSRLRWAWGYLRGLRAMWTSVGLGDSVERLVAPVEPLRLARSAWLSLVMVAVVVLSVPIALISLLALAAT